VEVPLRDGGIVILSGAGLSAASGVPTFRDANGLWEGHRFEDVATPEAWFADRALVQNFYDQRRQAGARVSPNPGHEALVQLQSQLGAERVALVTQNIDGLLTAAGAEEVIEVHGSLWRLKCDRNPRHPKLEIDEKQDPTGSCSQCEGLLRPDVVWFGEIPYALDAIYRAVSSCSVFLSVGTSGLVYPAAGLVAQAQAAGAYCLEVNPQPAGGPFHQVIAEGSEIALPRIIEEWLAT